MSHLRLAEASSQPLDSILSINYTNDVRVYNAFKLLYSHTVGYTAFTSQERIKDAACAVVSDMTALTSNHCAHSAQRAACHRADSRNHLILVHC